MTCVMPQMFYHHINLELKSYLIRKLCIVKILILCGKCVPDKLDESNIF